MTQYVIEKVRKVETPIYTWVAVLFLGIAFSLYIYFINGAIMATMARQETSEKMAVLASSLADKEAEYGNISAIINESFANNMGFVEAKEDDTTFVSVVSSVANLSINNGI